MTAIQYSTLDLMPSRMHKPLKSAAGWVASGEWHMVMHILRNRNEA